VTAHAEQLSISADEDPGRPDIVMPFREAADLLAQAYCLTLVRGLGVDETFARLGADLDASTTFGFCELVGAAYADPAGLDRQLAGAAELDGWTLVLEPNGYACTDRRRMRKVSRRTMSVTLYRTADTVQELSINADGRRLSTLDVLSHRWRSVERPGLFDHPVATAVVGADPPRGTAGAVLVERFTGVPLSLDLLARLRYRSGTLDGP
jgi:Family of unknown function (DUF6461)